MKVVGRYLAALKGLSLRRVLPLGLATLSLAAMLLAGMYVFNKPVRSVLYSGLAPDDVSQIGMVLSESGISFDVNEGGTAVLVDFGKASQARMILAEKGLPKSDKSGYQLFDQMGSLGLTSFMQQVTRVRALEGELVRTIQQLDGVKTARVHLALKPDNVLHGTGEQPTASVVIRTLGRPNEQTIRSIRQIVAAAIPGMAPDHVTVLSTDGTTLGRQPPGAAETDALQSLEQSVSTATQERIERTLAPVAGVNNIRVSVTTLLNTDKHKMQETNFDPESKVERSMRTIKSSDQTSDNPAGQSVSADQNIPQEIKSTSPGDQSTKKKENKEETVNYEVNSKQIDTVSEGFRVEKQSLAVVINKQALAKSQGDPADEKKFAAQMAEIEALVKTSAGFDEKRGDVVHVSAIDFAPEDAAQDAVAGPGIIENLKGNLGTVINAIAMVAVVALVLGMGLRPALKFVSELPVAKSDVPLLPSAHGEANAPTNPALALGGAEAAEGNSNLRDKLNRVVSQDINRSAQVIKQWLAEKPGELHDSA